MEIMEIFTILGLALFLFVVMVILSVFLTIAFGDKTIGFLCVMLVLSVILSLFFTQSEKFGYEKIVSNNYVEQEVKE